MSTIHNMLLSYVMSHAAHDIASIFNVNASMSQCQQHAIEICLSAATPAADPKSLKAMSRCVNNPHHAIEHYVNNHPQSHREHVPKTERD
jgi:hypothetical protein